MDEDVTGLVSEWKGYRWQLCIWLYLMQRSVNPRLRTGSLHKDGHVFGEWAELHCGLDTLRTDSVPTALTSVCGSSDPITKRFRLLYFMSSPAFSIKVPNRSGLLSFLEEGIHSSYSAWVPNWPFELWQVLDEMGKIRIEEELGWGRNVVTGAWWDEIHEQPETGLLCLCWNESNCFNVFTRVHVCFSESLRSGSEVSDVSTCSCVRFVPLARGQSVQTDGKPPTVLLTRFMKLAAAAAARTLNDRLLA